MISLEIALGIAAVLVFLPVSVLALETLASLLPGRGSMPLSGKRPRVAVVMPAHNEAPLIEQNVREILPQLHASDRLVVVADNCSDETAALASAAGAEVIVREDPSRRGKGYALDFGMQHLTQDPPEIVLIVDADCQLAAGCVDTLARMSGEAARPVQALYLMRSPPGAGMKLRIAEFAWILKNWVRPLGLKRLGLPCQLMGTGMAVPWECLRGISLATGHIVEDLKLGLELANSGSAPLFCPEARVMSQFPSSEEGFVSQRTRWEHGYLSVLLHDAPSLIANSLRTRNGSSLALGFDLCVPPIALLTLLSGALWLASTTFLWVTGVILPFLIITVSVALLGLCVFLSWARFARDVVTLGNLALAVAYALWKIPLYARFLVARQMVWVRSKRDQEGST